MSLSEYPSVPNAFIKYALQEQKEVRRIQFEKVGSNGVKLGQMGSRRVTCGQEGQKEVKWVQVGLGKVRSGLVGNMVKG